MDKETRTLLLFLFIIFGLILVLNPSYIGITAGSSSFTEGFGSWWGNIGAEFQTGMIIMVFIVVIVLIIGGRK